MHKISSLIQDVIGTHFCVWPAASTSAAGAGPSALEVAGGSIWKLFGAPAVASTTTSGQASDYWESSVSRLLRSKHTSHFPCISLDSPLPATPPLSTPSHSLYNSLPPQTIASQNGFLGFVGRAREAASAYAPPTGEQITLFLGLLSGGLLFLAIAFFVCLPVIVLSPRKFALAYTLGCALVLSAFAALRGFRRQMQHMVSSDRLPFTAVYALSMAGTLYFAIVQQVRVTQLRRLMECLQLL